MEEGRRILQEFELCKAAYLSYVGSRPSSPLRSSSPPIAAAARQMNSVDVGSHVYRQQQQQQNHHHHHQQQQQQQEQVQQRPKKPLSSEQVLLASLPTSSKSPQEVWDEHIRELIIFKRTHGHCRVPRHYGENPKLGRWVMNVRSHYQFLKRGTKKSSLITEERLRQLEALEFDFAPKNKSHTKYYVDRWAQHVSDLEEFKAKHGHCRVPQRYKENRKLGGWVLYVRHQFKKFKAVQPSTMTAERVKQLEDLGFDFNPRKGRPGITDEFIN